ncbi:Glutamate or tyrosine decarboxylase [Microterricola viridarii]|uniref:Glutamate or tyrosine decarboxylase n=2 Tax=Microterricola viridarii TaxID=412690 RepID=A0A1H1WXS5_9MICO|nr:Glutamate or tyrosine decarboxylase [Microterricola viridarii]
MDTSQPSHAPSDPDTPMDPVPLSGGTQTAPAPTADYDAVLDTAAGVARRWLDGVFSRPIPATHDIDQVKAAIGRELPPHGLEAESVIEQLAAAVEPGLMASQSGRFFGWVMGGTYPVALAADWLVSAWDQNAGMRDATPGVIAAEELAGEWLLQLLGLPGSSDVGFVTGATAANFVGLAAGRQHVLEQAGWDVNRDGLSGAPRIRLIAGAERHGAVDLAARYLGLGEATLVPADAHGRISIAGLARALGEGSGPTIVCLQAGNIHSGAFDDFAAASALCRAACAWQHVDGAFGLWAGAAPGLRHLTAGYELADSWATDAHKTLNVPYDCGVAIVARPTALHTAFGVHASYLLAPAAGADPFEKVPEMSRRARGVPLLATLRWLGRDGVEELVTGLAQNASRLAEELAALPGVSILNDVVFTQVCMAMPDDEATTALGERLLAEGRVLASPSHWHDRAVLRFSVSNWATDADEVRTTVDAVRAALPPR